MDSPEVTNHRKFVDSVTSEATKDCDTFIERLDELQDTPRFHVPQRVLIGAIGICSEGGELLDIVKKIIFQGKPYNEENVFHMKRELGDICWYLAQACMALDTTFDEVIEMNVDKLKARYPGGEFDVHNSENRKEGDL